MIILEILGHVVFWLVMIAAIFLIPVGIPGTFLIVTNSLVYGWLTGFADVTLGLLGLLLIIALVAEAVEFVIGAATAGRYGGSRYGMLGAVIGGITGAIWMTPVLPVIGTLAGAFMGAFTGATIFEYFQSRDMQKSLRVGYGAFLGSVGGQLMKVAAAIAMVVIVGIRII